MNIRKSFSFSYYTGHIFTYLLQSIALTQDLTNIIATGGIILVIFLKDKWNTILNNTIFFKFTRNLLNTVRCSNVGKCQSLKLES